VRAAAESITESLDKVHESMVEFFGERAQQLIDERGAKVALAQAMALICGYTQPFKSRSLLSSMEGATTVHIKQSHPLRSPMQVIDIVCACVDDPSIANKIADIR